MDGIQVGWVDLVSGERALALPDMAAAFDAAIATVSHVRLNTTAAGTTSPSQ